MAFQPYVVSFDIYKINFRTRQIQYRSICIVMCSVEEPVMNTMVVSNSSSLTT